MKQKIDDINLYNIPNVEIFKSGTWKGDTYTKDDLINIERNFSESRSQNPDFELPIKLGHNQSDSEPAVGWLTNIRVFGESLIGDFVDLPESIYKAIKVKAYKNRSVELLETVRDGKVNRVLKAIALLGAKLPGVNMEDIKDGAVGVSRLGKALYGKAFSEDGETKIIEFSESEFIDGSDDDMKKKPEDQEESTVDMACGGSKQDEKKFSEEDFNEMKKMFAEMTEKVNAISTENAELKKLNFSLENGLVEAKRKEDQAFIDTLIAENKVLPAQRERLFSLLNDLDEKEVQINFSDDNVETSTRVKVFRDFLSSLPSMGMTEMKAKAGGDPASLDYKTVVNKFSEEMFNKTYAECNVSETKKVMSAIKSSEQYKKYITE